MTIRRANLIVIFLLGGYVLYRALFPPEKTDSYANMILSLSIEIVGALLLYFILQFLQNIKQLWLFVQTRFILRNTDVRLSIAYLYRIKVDNKYLLVKSRTRTYFQPVGGVFKTLPGSERIFDKLKVKSDRHFETDHGIAKGDLRVVLKGSNVIEFLEWFNSKADREISPWREFCEELISKDILPWKEFRYIDYKFRGIVQSPIFTLDTGMKGMFLFEIYDLVVNDEQKPILQSMMNENSPEFIWVDDYLIQRLGHDESRKKQMYEIAPHAKYAQNMKWEK